MYNVYGFVKHAQHNIHNNKLNFIHLNSTTVPRSSII